MANKKTRVEVLREVLEVEGVKNNEEYTKVIDTIISQIEKKNAYRSEKVSATKEKNLELIEKIKNLLKDNSDKKFTLNEIQNGIEELKGLSNQKISSLLKVLCDNGEIIRVKEKKTTFYQIAL